MRGFRTGGTLPEVAPVNRDVLGSSTDGLSDAVPSRHLAQFFVPSSCHGYDEETSIVCEPQ